jgi:hypothetical protein
MTQTFPPLLNRFQGDLFFGYAITCAVSFFFVMFCIPETKKKSLEEIEMMWIKN